MSFQKLTLIGNGVTIQMNQNLHAGQNFYTVSNVKEMLSSMGTRHSETPRQADHGVEDSLSHYGARFLPFEGEIHAQSVAQRVTMEQNLRQCLSLKRSQNQSSDDGYILVQITDDDGEEKQCYAKVIDLPEFSWIAAGQTARSRFRFSMMADDPFLYAQELSEETGPEAVYVTPFTLQDDDLQGLQDDNLPSLQDTISSGITVENIGTIGTSPVIIIHGPTADPIITNETSGKIMDLDGLTLLADERVEIDVASYTITKFDTSDVESDASSFLTAASDWIFLEPGYNDLNFTDSTPNDLTATIEVEFRSTWI